MAAALVVAAIVLGRAHDEPEAAVAVAWMGTGYAAVAGFLTAPADPLLGYPLLGYPMAAAGAAASAAGLVALLSLSEGRSLLIPPAAGGALLGIAGLAIETWDLSGPRVLTAALVAVVLVGSLLPWLALGATGTRVEQMYSEADVSRDPERLDAAAIAADARLAHEILVAVSGCVGLLLVLIAPWATRLGAAGTMLAVTCCAVVMLRTRQYRTGAEVGVGLVSGVLGLAVVAASVLVWHPSWRPGAAMVLAVTGAVLLAATLMPSAPSIRRGRLGDVAESVALLALLPLTVVATGLFDAIRG